MIIFALTVSFLAFAPPPSSAQETGLSVVDSVTTALRYSPRLQMMKRNEQAIGYERDRAFGGYLPRVDVNLGYGAEAHSDEYTRSKGNDHHYYDRTEASVRLTQLLYDGKETASRVGIEQAKLESAGYRTLDNAEATALDAIVAHMEVYRQQQLYQLAEQNVSDHQDILGKLDERQRAGAGSIADIDQTQGRLSRAYASLAQVEGALRSAEANYLRTVGELPRNLAFYNLGPEMVAENLDDATELAKKYNPKILAYNANITEAEKRLELSRANFHPKFYAELSGSHEDQVESSETYENNFQAMVRMRWNVFNGWSDVADYRAAHSRRLQAVAARNDQADLIMEETRATWAELATARRQIASFTDAVEFNRRTLDSYSKQFNVGQRTLLDVLDARNELFQSSSLLATAKANEVIAAKRLLALNGNLIQSLGIDRELYAVNHNRQ
ncbi:MAG: TolC family outer membrane protein [Desulfuromonadaceae bacterium]|nr:TolC family outer membrane protein [Desulfuromonadaceae bacterium]